MRSTKSAMGQRMTYLLLKTKKAVIYFHLAMPREGKTSSAVGSAAGNKSVWLNYNPADYKNLNISPEIKDLFKHITNYIPEVYELETHLKPFIPEYIPAIGEVDAFIKIPRPDNEEENLGISIIDE